jgi:hypothetical protein
LRNQRNPAMPAACPSECGVEPPKMPLVVRDKNPTNPHRVLELALVIGTSGLRLLDSQDIKPAIPQKAQEAMINTFIQGN